MKQALYIFTRDVEDGGGYGFQCAFPLPDEKTATYEEAINHLLPILSSKAVVDKLIEEDCLGENEDDFDGRPYKFVSCGYRNYSLEYDFEYCGDDEDYEGDVVTCRKSLDFILIAEGS